MTSEFSAAILEARRQASRASRLLRKNGVQPSITYSAEPAARVRANKAVP